MPKMPFACRKTRDRISEESPRGSQPLWGVDHTLSSPPALPFTEDKKREAVNSVKAKPCSVGPRGSPQGERKQARMTQQLHRRMHRERGRQAITGSPEKPAG